MASKLLIRNCTLLGDRRGSTQAEILIVDGIIAHIGTVDEPPADAEVLDADGRAVAPGFIDVHIQGAGGADVLDGTEEALEKIARTCVRFGTTGFLATTVYRTGGDNSHLRLAALNTGRDLGGAALLGIHLEGPFISPDMKGMIQPDSLCLPSSQVLETIRELTRGSLKMMTIAPELPGALEIVRQLVKRGVIASLGHCAASYEETRAAIAAGVSHVTHLFNAMPSMHHRKPGPVAAILTDSRITAQVIADGVHLHPAVLKMAFNLLGEKRCLMVTDGVQALGLGDGTYSYNGVEYESRSGTPRYADGTLIGTSLGLSELIPRLMLFTRCSRAQAVATVTENPARLLGIYHRKGSIAEGKDGDVVILENDCSVFATVVAGTVVYRSATQS